jgi:DNA-binding winged helix-turn-helix (wHTH) protein
LYLINQLVEFNPDSKSLVNRLTGRSIQLQLPASLCLLYLITHPNEVVSQNALMKVGWGERNDVTTPNTFYQAILTLRNALEDVGLARDTVKTISRRGLTLIENTRVDVVTPSLGDVHESPVIEERELTAIIPPLLQRQSRVPLWLTVCLTGLSIVTVVIWLVWYQTRPVMPFSQFLPVSMQTPSSTHCKIYYSPNEHDLDSYFQLMQAHPELCGNNQRVYLSGYSKAERVVAFVCDKDARADASAFCTTHYYWTRRK